MPIDDLSILLLLVFAHLLGDFMLQPTSWVKSKEERGMFCLAFWLHIAVHTVLPLLILLIFNPKFWWISIAIGGGHALVDAIKCSIKKWHLRVFLLDQVAHIASILIFWKFFYISKNPEWLNLEFLLSPKTLIIAIAYFLVYYPMSLFMQLATAQWAKEIKEMGLENAGRWIGKLERLLILTFILSSNFSSIGFLIAAKSVFRYGDLKEAENQKRTEYILIGTLLSFSITIFLGLFSLYLINELKGR